MKEVSEIVSRGLLDFRDCSSLWPEILRIKRDRDGGGSLRDGCVTLYSWRTKSRFKNEVREGKKTRTERRLLTEGTVRLLYSNGPVCRKTIRIYTSSSRERISVEESPKDLSFSKRCPPLSSLNLVLQRTRPVKTTIFGGGTGRRRERDTSPHKDSVPVSETDEVVNVERDG